MTRKHSHLIACFKFTTLFLLITAVSAGIAGPVMAGWQSDQYGHWYQLPDGGYPVNTWFCDNELWYHFDRDGYMETGWIKDDVYDYYLAESGAMAIGWKDIGGIWYYFNSNGVMATDWTSIDGNWYYFAENGAMCTGWIEDGGYDYYLAESGAMAIGWKDIGGIWYYFDSNGVMATDWISIDGSWYYFAENGAMCTGWIEDGGKWYYLDESGKMLTGWHFFNGNWYYLCADGHMAADCWVKDRGGIPCYLAWDGKWVNGALSWIGDSISALPNGQNAIKDAFYNPDVDAQEGRAVSDYWDGHPSGIETAYQMTAEGRMHRTLVFALGTNIGFTPYSEMNYTQRIGLLRTIIGYDTWIVLTTCYDTDSEKDQIFADINNEIRSLAATDARIAVADWAAVCNPATDLSDHVHPSPSGAVKYMNLIQNALADTFGPE